MMAEILRNMGVIPTGVRVDTDLIEHKPAFGSSHAEDRLSRYRMASASTVKMREGIDVVVFERLRIPAEGGDETPDRIQSSSLFEHAGTLSAPLVYTANWVEFAIRPRGTSYFRRDVLYLVVPLQWVRLGFFGYLSFQWKLLRGFLPVVDVPIFYQGQVLAMAEDPMPSGASLISIGLAPPQNDVDPSLLPSVFSITSSEE